MPFISITFSSSINVSCQPGDQVYSTNVSPVDGNNVIQLGQLSSSYLIGTVYNLINANGVDASIPIQIIIEYTGPEPTIQEGEFLMFSKNKLANTSGITGYFAEVDFINNSKKEAELFAVSSSIALSSQ